MRNESTPGARGPVFCGVDTHADSHWLCVLDWRGRKVLSRQFPADAAGYEALAGAIAAAGEPACVAMEGTSSYGAGLTRHLASLGMPVREALSPAGMQRRRPGQGKCDEADAERAARAAMSGSRLGTPKSQDGWVDGVRCMLAARSRGGEGADLGDQHREVAAHHRAGGAQVEVPRHGRAEADGGAPLRARRGLLASI